MKYIFYDVSCCFGILTVCAGLYMLCVGVVYETLNIYALLNDHNISSGFPINSTDIYKRVICYSSSPIGLYLGCPVVGVMVLCCLGVLGCICCLIYLGVNKLYLNYKERNRIMAPLLQTHIEEL